MSTDDRPSEQHRPPATCALEGFAGALDQLIDAVEAGGLDHFDSEELLDFMRSFERVRNKMSVVDHRVVADCDRREMADHLTCRNTKSLLTHVLRLSPHEASRRVRAAAAVGTRTTMLGERLDPLRPDLAELQRAGVVSSEQVAIVESCLDELDRPGLVTAEVQAAERLMTGYAVEFGPRELRRIGAHLVDVVNPDGSVPRDRINFERRHLELRRNGDGSYSLSGRLTGPVGAALFSVLQPLARPRVDSAEVTVRRSAGPLAADAPKDPRTNGMRMHDALDDVCARLLRSGGLPDSGGTPTTLIVTLSAEDLSRRLGFGETSDGTLIPIPQLLQLASEADIIPVVLNQSGLLLEMGRSRRVATKNQTLALIARDGGCSFPGCAHPPEWCDRHHIKEWISGGATSVSNLTLLCRYHHGNFVSHGWTCRMNAGGLPEWIPPRWLDREQRPLVNQRISGRQLRQVLDRGGPPPSVAADLGTRARADAARLVPQPA